MRSLVASVLVFLHLFAPKAHAQSYGTCDPGYYWSSNLNRCLISDQDVETKRGVLKCSGLSGEDYTKCYNDIASERVGELEQSGEIENYEKDFNSMDATRIVVPITISLITGYYLFMNKDKFKDCKATSMWLIFGGGVVTLLGEIAAQIKFKAATDAIAKEYSNKIENNEADSDTQLATENQKIAFDYLIDSNVARRDSEKIRRGTHTLAVVIYSAALVMATVESIQTGFRAGEAACGPPPKKKVSSLIDDKTNAQKYYDYLSLTSDEFDGYSHVKNLTPDELLEVFLRRVYNNIIPRAYAEDGTTTNEDSVNSCSDTTMKWDAERKECVPKEPAPKAPESSDAKQNQMMGTVTQAINSGGLGPAAEFIQKNNGDIINSPMAKKQMNLLDKALATPYIRAAIAGGMVAYAEVLRRDAVRNIEIAEKRIEAITKLRDDFLATGGASYSMCDEEQRNNQGNPRCFCFTEDGEKDMSKSKLSACAGVFREFEAKAAGNYTKDYGDSVGNRPLCMDRNSNLDPKCKCKIKNSCLKISSSMNLSGLGGAWLSGLSAPTDNITNGNLDGSQLDTTKLNDMAIKLNKKIKAMEKDPKYKASLKKINDFKNKMQTGHQNWYRKSFGNSTPKSLSTLAATSATNSAPTTAADALKLAKEKIKSAEVKFKKGKGAKEKAQEQGDDFDFGWGNDNNAQGGGTQIEEYAQVMDKNYAIKGDINNNPSQNLFDILSVRYQRSGLRRLFDTEGKSSVDEANRTDINEK